MARVIEIRATTADLRSLLALIGENGARLVWSILDLEAVGDPEKLKTDLLEIEWQAQELPQGLILKWEDLVVLADSLADVWNILLVAAHDSKSIQQLEPLSEDFGEHEIVIECFDSSFWRVYARDEEI